MEDRIRIRKNLFNRYRFNFDSSVPFLVYVFYTKTHLLSPTQYNVPLSKDREKLHRVIFNLKEEGLGYKRIHRKLVEMGMNVGKSPNTIDSIIKKRLKRDEILNQPIIEEYRDFDLQFLRVNQDD
ncbi:MAG: hypothetical protein QGH89_05795 [Candidatus Marinimicrobia bacterium]|nr:hypothetical protein [Candidatus Neomarinimicrobiota bacterium]